MSEPSREIQPDFTVARERRRFFITRGLRNRRASRRAADIGSLMALARKELPVDPKGLLESIPFCVIGGVATRAYMPERMTKDLDILVGADDVDAAQRYLSDKGYAAGAPHDDRFFANSMLGLFGRVWQRGDVRIDLISSRQEWVREALAAEAFDQTGLRVIALPYLVLMKLDASRGQGQADVERMLGRLTDQEVADVARVVERYSGDPQAAQDVYHYAQLGRLEYGIDPRE